MPRTKPLRDMASAPRDGTVVEVRHGPEQQILRAVWAGQNQAFVAADDENQKTLRRVIGWRPCKGSGMMRRKDILTAQLILLLAASAAVLTILERTAVLFRAVR
jgi:hypothetical protein